MNNINFFGGTDPVKTKVQRCISNYERQDVTSLQQSLFELYQEFNKRGGGTKITNYDRKDQLCECFTMMLNYDWMQDSDIREVFAEDGFYCIATYLKKDAKTMQDMIAGALDLLLLINAGEKHLYPKFNEILHKAQIRSMFMHGPESTIFTQKDFQGGATYVLRQFKFFAATIISKIERQYPEIISPTLRTEYENAKNDFEFASITPEIQINKMNFFANIIGSILEDM